MSDLQRDDTQFDQETVFHIGLEPTGHEGSTYRTQNDPAAPHQRTTFTERPGAVDVRCECLDIVHGGLQTGTNDGATLIVLEFTFDARKAGRRIKSANVSLQFSSLDPRHDPPEVLRIAPVGNLTIETTTQFEEKKSTGSVSVGAPPVAGLEAGMQLSIEKTTSGERMDATRVVGSRDLRGRTWGKKNTASWSLMENATTKAGVPTVLRTAILLKRQHDEQFKCVFEIEAEVDFMSSLERMFGSRTPDDPVLFDPFMDPTNCLQVYDLNDLGSLSLEDLSTVTFMTLFGKGVKHSS